MQLTHYDALEMYTSDIRVKFMKNNSLLCISLLYLKNMMGPGKLSQHPCLYKNLAIAKQWPSCHNT